MRPRDLWELMTDILSRCLQEDPVDSPEQILKDTLEGCATLEEDEATLAREIVSGILHFEKVCQGMLKGYCECLRRNKVDKFSMYIVTYLMVFQYTALGGHRIRELIYRCTFAPRLVEFLDYVLSPQNLMTHSNPYWNEYYDANFIMSTIYRPLVEIAPHAREDIIQWILNKTAIGVVGVNDTEDVKKSSTQKEVRQKLRVTDALQQQQKQQKKIPPAEVRAMLHTIPEKRPPRIDYKKVPDHPLKYQVSPTKPIGFSFMRRPINTISREEEQPVCQEKPLHPSLEEVRKKLSKPVSVRMTAGAIRREAQNYLKQVEEQKRSLEEKEAALHDSREFEEWRRQETAREAEQRAAKLLDRKVEIKLASENAVRKRKAIEEMKRNETLQMQADLALKTGSWAAEKESEARRQREQASRVRREMEEKRKKAIDEAQRERQTTAAIVKAESEQLKENVLEEEKKLKMQRVHVIQQIRHLRERNRQRREAMQGQKAQLQKETSEDLAYGGMSLCELRERLRQLKKENAQMEEERRARIQAQRQQEREKLDDLASMCSHWRQNTRRAKDEERNNRKEEESNLVAQREEEEEGRAVHVRNLLKQKRRDRRAEHLILKAEDRRRRNELLLLAKGAFDIEEKHWMQQELGIVNRLTVEQNERLRAEF